MYTQLILIQFFFFFFNNFRSIYTSIHDNPAQIPIGNNTGSLPDLPALMQYGTPLPTPIDNEHDHSSSPYSSVCLS